MSYRTQVFNMLPWSGGINTALDPALIGKNELTVGENIIFTARTSKKQRPAINYDWDDASSSTSSIIGLSEYWYEDSAAAKQQQIISIDDSNNVYSYDPADGTRSTLTLTSTSTAWTSVVSVASSEVINNLFIFAVDGVDNKIMSYSGTSTSYQNLENAPEGSIVRQHLGRLWTNDKTRPDRLHYSTTFNPTEWLGVGDSGALDIGLGDGDPEGITAIFPSFKGVLFVAKRTKLYKISGYTPESFIVELVSSGIGCVSHNSIALIDQDDIYFVSERGVHSIKATDAYGDFEGAYLSLPIQTTFTDRFVKSRLKYAKAVYVPTLNSYALSVTDDAYSSTENKAIWLFNTTYKAWYEWPNLSCESIAGVQQSGKRIFYLGSSTTRVAQGLVDSDSDTSESGVAMAILFTAATGQIYPTDNIYTQVGFKKIGIALRPEGNFELIIKFQIDGQEEQQITYSKSDVEVLDVDFVLDESVLQPTSVLDPAIFSIDGYGRSFVLTIEQASTNKNIEIQGFSVEYEMTGPQQESGLTES